MAISGQEFNTRFANLEFYKFTNETNAHYGMTYTDGLNIDIKPFSTSDSKTGLYFFETKRVSSHYKSKYTHIRKVTIPDDALVIIREASFRADRFILEPSKHIGEDLNLLSKLVTVGKWEINEELYKKILSVNDPSKKYEILGILADVWCISQPDFIPDNEIAEAIVKYPHIIKAYTNISPAMYKLALSLNGMLLENIVRRYKKIISCQESLCCFVLKSDVETLYEEYKRVAISQNYEALQFVENPSDELCIIALLQSENATKYIKVVSKPVAEFAIQKYPHLSKNSKYKIGLTQETAMQVMTSDPNNISIIPTELQTEEMCKIALTHDIRNAKHINENFLHLIQISF